MWERHVQNSNFTAEINAIKSSTRKKPVLTIDEHGIVPESISVAKLIQKHVFTSLIINSLHEKLIRAEVSYPIHRQLLEENSRYHKEEQLWEQFFWTVKDVKGSPYRMPQMVPCPPSRIEESLLFKCIRLDYLGPLVCESGQWIIDTQGVGLPIYLLSNQSCPFRNHQWHVCKVFPFLPRQFLVFLFRRGKPKSIISYIKSVIYQVKICHH